MAECRPSSDRKERPECTVCMELYDTDNRYPRVLICGHTYCHPCLENLCTHTGIVCPLCGNTTDIRNADVSQCVPKNFALLSMLKNLCHNCTNHWTEQCNSCKQSLCDTCLQRHTDRHQLERSLVKLAADQQALIQAEQGRLQLLHQNMDKTKQQLKRFFRTCSDMTPMELLQRLTDEADRATEAGSSNFTTWKDDFEVQHARSLEVLKTKLGELHLLDVGGDGSKKAFDDLRFQCDVLRARLDSYEPNPNLNANVDLLSNLLKSVVKDSNTWNSPFGPWDIATCVVFGVLAFVVFIVFVVTKSVR